MSVISVKLVKMVSKGSLEGRTEQQNWVIQCDSASDTAFTARAAVGFPHPGDLHPTDPDMYCTEHSADYDEASADPWVYRCSVTYTLLKPGDKKDPDPENDPVEFACRGVSVIYPMHRDKSGKPVVNSAYDTFDPPPNGQEFDEEITITKSVTTIDPDLIHSYRGAVNSASFTVIMQDGTSRTFAAKSVRMEDINYQLASRNGSQYWRVSFNLNIRKITTENSQPWRIRILDEGYRKLVGGLWGFGGTWKDIMIDSKRPTHPMLLDGAGAVLASGGEPVLLLFKDYVELPFGTLNLTN